MENYILQSKNITKEFSGDVVLKGIDLNIKPGEFITILGPSGCGKTTFLKIISGIETPSSGDLILENKSIKNWSPHKRPINTIFQNYALFPHMNVFDNVAYGLKIKKISKIKIKQEVLKFLELVNLPNYEYKKISELSGGQKQRVAIARALINNPKILLLDEPMSALDVQLKKQMQQNLKKLQKEVNITFILVTHDQEEALSLSDRIIVINNGVIEQVGSPEEIYNEPENSWVATFIGESNIISNGKILKDNLVFFDNVEIKCKATNFGKNETSVDFLIRPEDIEITKKGKGFFDCKVISKTFKGDIWEINVKHSKNRYYNIHTVNDSININDEIGINWKQDKLHVMWKDLDQI